ncbi:DUF4780 domain-containing protein, partial [Klebsiella pneumoniae]|uniref:DUF4780 domain-containing protein n=1 Tax=Klebsiella pneumoniae TaxID=573 RepID=UPI004055397C
VEFPRKKTLVTFLPEAKDYNNDEIKKYLKIQNDNLAVENWQVNKRVELSYTTQLSFKIEEKSANKLINGETQLYFGMGRVNYHIVGEKGQIEKEEGGDATESGEDPKKDLETTTDKVPKAHQEMEGGKEVAMDVEEPGTSTPKNEERRVPIDEAFPGMGAGPS